MHTPVLLHELIDGLSLKAGDTVLDCTLGGGGHATAACGKVGRRGTLVGLDADATAIERAREAIAECPCTTTLVRANFRNAPTVLARLGITTLQAAYLDLGYSSDQLEASGRGFSFARDEALMMTYEANPAREVLTARDLIAAASHEDLVTILRVYGEERSAKKLADAIVKARDEQPITTSKQLADVVAQAIPSRRGAGKLHPATKVFQALRIAVNDELEALREALEGLPDYLSHGAHVAVISFHSLEDRIVKRTFREWSRAKRGRTVTKKPITPSRAEVNENPRARSAKLRIFQMS